MKLFDGHLDMALNALDYERDQTLSVARLREREAAGTHDGRGVATVSLDELRQGGCGVVLSTVIARAKPWVDPCRADLNDCDWPDATMAYAIAMGQLAYYRLLEQRGHLRLLTSAGQLQRHVADWNASPATTPVGMILTMEGADPIADPSLLQHWYDAGVRTLMLAHFGKSHYAHGTPPDKPKHASEGDGPLTDWGRRLLPEMDKLGMPLDLTHTSDQTFDEAAAIFRGRIYSSHTCCRSLNNIPRNHTDAQLKQIIARDGVIGLPMFNVFLLAGYDRKGPKSQATYATVAQHIDHICQLAGSARHVAIGSDCDGGFGKEHMPAELETHRDLIRLADTLVSRNYSDADIAGILHGNWLRFFMQTLPA